jgi:hypothetical protein
VAKREVYARLRTVLRGQTNTPDLAMPVADRTAILEILEATKPDFAATKPR